MTALQQTCLSDLEAAHLLRLLRQVSGLSVEALLLSSSLLQRLLLSSQSLVILDKPFHFSEIAALLLQGAASCYCHTERCKSPGTASILNILADMNSCSRPKRHTCIGVGMYSTGGCFPESH